MKELFSETLKQTGNSSHILQIVLFLYTCIWDAHSFPPALADICFVFVGKQGS